MDDQQYGTGVTEAGVADKEAARESQRGEGEQTGSFDIIQYLILSNVTNVSMQNLISFFILL